jgi:hypothetical protein
VSEAFLAAAYTEVSPTIWNRKLTTLKSLCASCRADKTWLQVDQAQIGAFQAFKGTRRRVDAGHSARRPRAEMHKRTALSHGPKR